MLTSHNAGITPCLLHLKERLTTVRGYLIISALQWGVRALTRSKKRKASDKLWVMKSVSPPSCNPWESKEELASVWTLVLVVGFWKEILFTLYTRPELYKPCSANKTHGLHSDKFKRDTTRRRLFLSNIFGRFMHDMKEIFQKSQVYLFRYKSNLYSLGSWRDAIFCINCVLIQTGSCLPRMLSPADAASLPVVSPSFVISEILS